MRTATTAAPTARQLEILDFIRESMRGSGMPPTIREIGAEMGIRTVNGVKQHLDSLVRKGLLRKLGEAKSRAYVPVVPEGACPCCARPMGEEGGAA